MGSSFRDDARRLKALGLVDWDLRRTPTGYKKRRAKQLLDKYHAVVKNPDKFFIKPVSEKTARRLRRDGKQVINNHLIMQKQGYTDLTVSTTKGTVSIRKTSAERGDTSFTYKNPLELLAKIRRIKLKPGEVITVRFGEHKPFSDAFQSGNDLADYLENHYLLTQIAALSIVRYFAWNKPK